MFGKLCYVTGSQIADAGQTLVTLNTTDLNVDLAVITSRRSELQVRKSRFLAQFTCVATFTGQDLIAISTTEMAVNDWQPAFAAQNQLFDTTTRARQAAADILRNTTPVWNCKSKDWKNSAHSTITSWKLSVDVFVNTSEKTALVYLAPPIKDRLARTFME